MCAHVTNTHCTHTRTHVHQVTHRKVILEVVFGFIKVVTQAEEGQNCMNAKSQ